MIDSTIFQEEEQRCSFLLRKWRQGQVVAEDDAEAAAGDVEDGVGVVEAGGAGEGVEGPGREGEVVGLRPKPPLVDVPGFEAHRGGGEEAEAGDDAAGELDAVDVGLDAAVGAEIDDMRRQPALDLRKAVAERAADFPEHGQVLVELGLAVPQNDRVPVVLFVPLALEPCLRREHLRLASASAERGTNERVVFRRRQELLPHK